MRGKDKCKILKEIRQQIALQNDIEWVVSECSHKGECKGTCPKCESEVRKLERELELRRKLGKAVALTGVSAACMAGLSACTVEDVVDYAQNVVDSVRDIVKGTNTTNGYMDVLEGEEVYIPEDYKGGQDEPETEDPYMLDGDVAYIPDDLELSGYVAYPDEDIDAVDDIDISEDQIFTTEGEVALD